MKDKEIIAYCQKHEAIEKGVYVNQLVIKVRFKEPVIRRSVILDISADIPRDFYIHKQFIYISRKNKIKA